MAGEQAREFSRLVDAPVKRSTVVPEAREFSRLVDVVVSRRPSGWTVGAVRFGTGSGF